MHGAAEMIVRGLAAAGKGRSTYKRLLMRTCHLNWLLIVGSLLISTAPLLAQAQQPDWPTLQANAQKVVSIISGDKAKTQTFCQMVIIGKQVDVAVQEKDNKKAAELAQKLIDLENNLGPEYVVLVDSLRNVDLNSKEAQEIVSTFDTLDASCPH
jgi:hypothetical protein